VRVNGLRRIVMITLPKTAGVYLNVNGLFAFAFGPNQNEGKLGIARFGGHIEAGETIAECVLREVKEETSLDVTLIASPITYKIDEWDSKLLEVEDEQTNIKPILRIGQNVMFFANSNKEPQLSSETKGIIFVNENELMKLCSSEITYGDFKACGGRSIVSSDYDEDFILQPLGQMRFLARLIQERPDILKLVYNA
jgi:NUDIX domain